MQADSAAPAMRLKLLKCGHEVMASPTAYVVRCAVCKRMVPVAHGH